MRTRWYGNRRDEVDIYAGLPRNVRRYLESDLGVQACRDAVTVADELRDGPLTVSELSTQCGLGIDRVRAALLYGLSARMVQPVRGEPGTWRRLDW